MKFSHSISRNISKRSKAGIQTGFMFIEAASGRLAQRKNHCLLTHGLASKCGMFMQWTIVALT